LPEITKSIASSKLGDNQRDFLIDICVTLHLRYDTFAEQLIKALEQTYWLVSV